MQDASPLKELRLDVDALDSGSFTVVYDDGTRKKWLEGGKADFERYVPGAKDVYISVAQEEDGQHVFIRPGEVLSLFSEREMKAAAGAKRLLYARRVRADEEVVLPLTCEKWDHVDLAPRGPFTNYSVVPWLCLGRTQALILSDEHTLTTRAPNEKIFEYLSLVVNCHEDRPDTSKYLAGSGKGRPPPKVVAHAVHKWYARGDSVVQKNDAVQREIWKALQTGTVAVHCLAGIHRAACIVACHFLYRHYQLGHAHVPCDCSEIYNKLQQVRPAVSPAYLDILRNYEAHCINIKNIAKQQENNNTSRTQQQQPTRSA